MPATIVLDSIAGCLRMTTLDVEFPTEILEAMMADTLVASSSPMNLIVGSRVVGAAKTRMLMTSGHWPSVLETIEGYDMPECTEIAEEIRAELDGSTPMRLGPGDWHLPYVDQDDADPATAITIRDLTRSGVTFDDVILEMATFRTLARISAARCARMKNVHHIKGQRRSVEVAHDLSLFSIFSRGPCKRVTFLEHQQMADHVGADRWLNPHLHGVSVGWVSNRKVDNWERWRDRKPSLVKEVA